MAPSLRRTRGSPLETPPAKKARSNETTTVKTVVPWVDVKPETKKNTTPGSVKRGKPIKPVTPNNKSSIVPSDAPPDSPYPTLTRPTAEECWVARDALSQLHSKFFRHKEEAQADGSNQLGPGNLGTAIASSTLALPSTGKQTPYTILHGTSDTTSTTPHLKPVLDSLVGTILSQNTTDATSAIAFANLKRAFPDWESVRVSKPAPLEKAVKCGGLAEIKIARIQVILNTLHEERGKACMEYLRDMDDEAVKKELSRFKGVGPKTISCVLMFCLKRPDFPVDAHVWKIAMTLGWIPKTASRDQAYEHLNRRVPDACKFDLHVLLVEHGKVFKNDAGFIRKAINKQLGNADSDTKQIGWLETLEQPGGIKEQADAYFVAKSGKSVCG